MKKNKLHFVLLFTFSLFFISCGGGGGGGSVAATNETGIFVDDVVQGIEYRNNGNIAFTNQKGQFTYTGGTIEFYIGNILIGSVNKLPNDKYLFIQDIMKVNRSKTDDVNVMKIATFLQSLDSDKSTQAIEIKKDDFYKFTGLKQNILNIDISKILKDNNFEEISQKIVREHLENVHSKYAFNQSEKTFLDKLFKTKYLWYNQVTSHNYSGYTDPNEMISDYRYKALDKWSYAQTVTNYSNRSTQQSYGF